MFGSHTAPLSSGHLRSRAQFVVLVLLFSTKAFATPLFVETFEGDLAAWEGPRSIGGTIIDEIALDPIQSDHSLLMVFPYSGGSIFTSSTFGVAGQSYVLEFDYLGICGTDDCGGFIGYSQDTSGAAGTHLWLGGTTTGGFRGYADLLPDTGSWEHVAISFVASYGDFHIMMEDWLDSGPGRDTYFDNIVLRPVEVPEPGSLSLIIGAFLALGLVRRRRLVD